MRKLTVLVIGLVLVFGIAAPAAASHGAQFEGLWTAIDEFDDSFMTLQITEVGRDGLFRVILTDFLATEGCDPDAQFRAFSTTATGDPGNGRFFATFDQIRCTGRSTVNPLLLPSFTIEFCSQELFEGDEGFPACPDPVAPNTMVDDLGNVWFHVGR